MTEGKQVKEMTSNQSGENPEENMGCTEAAVGTETDEQYIAAIDQVNQQEEMRAYEEAKLVSELDKSHPFVRKADGKRFTTKEFEEATKPGQKAKKDDFVLRPRAMAAVTPAMLAHQGVWAIERTPNFWSRGKLVDKIAQKLYVRNDDPSTVIVEAAFEDLSDSAKENYTRITTVQYKDKKSKPNPVPWSEMGQRMSPSFRQARAEVILRSPDCEEWRGHFERLIDDGAEVMAAAEDLLPEEAPRDIDSEVSQVAEIAQEHSRNHADTVPGE